MSMYAILKVLRRSHLCGGSGDLDDVLQGGAVGGLNGHRRPGHGPDLREVGIVAAEHACQLGVGHAHLEGHRGARSPRRRGRI